MPEETLSRINYFRSTEEERWQWELAAQKAGLRLSEWLRQAANEKAVGGKKGKKNLDNAPGDDILNTCGLGTIIAG